MKHLSIKVSLPLSLVVLISLTLHPNRTLAQTLSIPSAEQPISTSPIDQATTRLKPGDRIQVTVVGFPELSGEQLISTEGTIQLPLAGSISLSGLILSEATEQISQVLLPYVRRPQVGIAIISLSPIHISVTGEVVKPGPRMLEATETEGNNSISLSQALILAGGITPNANLRNIIIRRASLGQSGDNPSTHEVTVNLWTAIESGNLASDVKIYNEDEIIVPTAQTNNANQQVLLSSTLAPDKLTVSVAGEVYNPGQVEVSPTASVSEAVAAAGGLTENARRDMLLLRRQPDGKMESHSFEFGNASEPLRNGDLILVQQSSRGRTSSFFEFLGNIFAPIAPLIRLFGG